jgi:hypothetical protein
VSPDPQHAGRSSPSCTCRACPHLRRFPPTRIRSATRSGRHWRRRHRHVSRVLAAAATLAVPDSLANCTRARSRRTICPCAVVRIGNAEFRLLSQEFSAQYSSSPRGGKLSLGTREERNLEIDARGSIDLNYLRASPAAGRAPIIATECPMVALLLEARATVQFLLRISSPASSTCMLMIVLLSLHHGGDSLNYPAGKSARREIQILDRIVVNLNS